MTYSHEYYVKHRKAFNDRAMVYYWKNKDRILAKRKLRREAAHEYHLRYYHLHKNDPPKPRQSAPEPVIPDGDTMPWQIREYFEE